VKNFSAQKVAVSRPRLTINPPQINHQKNHVISPVFAKPPAKSMQVFCAKKIIKYRTHRQKPLGIFV
jgi:hypothetical protein